ncbi:alpha/beta fold hydrolase (plasmid) [Acinetobacter corruptisaponis]|uniref:Alpha/beta fold hydrolase n=1 Tax=Acinetobacter corruptisaponis TaxID=3045147 RepID=A0ABY8S7Q6_9GAMM|nr:alpha/beta fold hydrolase [Acinetobacter sp. KCTC 92772]WHP07727.1 alpha/beta fold hydrolase [Acinetobacter sp. KCTC 92772]
MNLLEKNKVYVNSGNICLAAYHWDKLDSKKESIVLIHGYPDSAEVWEDVAQHLKSDFNVIAYDVRGTGLSDIPATTQEYDFEYLVQDLSAVIAKLSPNKPIHLVGHDWGALQAWEAVLGDRLKDQVASYIAMAPSADHVGWWFKRQWAEKRYLSVIKRMVSSGYMPMLRLPVLPEFTWRLGLDKVWPKAVGFLEKTQVSANSTQVRNAISGLGLYRQNLLTRLYEPTSRKTSIPVYMLLMNQDPFVPVSLSLGMQEWADHVEYDEVTAGHWGILSQPQAVAEKIKGFVNKL